ncbi:MAG: hypothetical protein ACREIV_10275 [Planctomycetaceae bacterium]
MSSRGLSTATPVLATAALVACGAGDAADDAIRSDSAGIEIVTSTGTDSPLAVTIERLETLGGEGAGPESFYRVSKLTVGADSAGNIYVLGSDGSEVVVFAPGGRFLRAMGSAGGGPGEIESAGSIAVADDGTVSVFDWGKMALVHFAPDGTILPEQPFQFPAAPNRQRHFAPVGARWSTNAGSHAGSLQSGLSR